MRRAEARLEAGDKRAPRARPRREDDDAATNRGENFVVEAPRNLAVRREEGPRPVYVTVAALAHVNDHVARRRRRRWARRRRVEALEDVAPATHAGPASARRSCAQSGTVAVASRSVTTFAHAVGAPGPRPRPASRRRAPVPAGAPTRRERMPAQRPAAPSPGARGAARRTGRPRRAAISTARR